MHENKKIEKNNEAKVAGGAVINGLKKTLIEESEIKKYEFKCQGCGKKSYHSNKSIFNRCPYCGNLFSYSPTGVVLLDYNYVNGANWRSVQEKDT